MSDAATDAYDQVTSRGLVSVACLTWFLYDWLLTLEPEIQFIWRRKVSFSTILFFLSRALPFIFLTLGVLQTAVLRNVSVTGCSIFHWVEGIGSIVIFVNSQVALQYRLWALYGRSRRVLIVNGTLFALEVTTAAIVCGMFYTRESRIDLPAGMVESCISVPQKEITAVFGAVFAFEFWLALLALRAVLRNPGADPVGGQSITRVIARDSIAYFFLISASVLAVVVIWIEEPLFPGNVAIAFTHAAGGIGSTRLVLNIKHEAACNRTAGSTIRPSAVRTPHLVFANDTYRSEDDEYDESDTTYIATREEAPAQLFISPNHVV